MTQKDINKFLANTKVYVNGKSKEIQQKLFSLGYKWNDGDVNVDYTKAPFLFIYENMRFAKSSDMEWFSSHEHREISAEEILSLELTEPDYRPFNNMEECWQEMLNHHPFGWLKNKNSGGFALIGSIYKGKEVWFVWATNGGNSYNAHDLFNDYVFTDGTPFGIKIE